MRELWRSGAPRELWRSVHARLPMRRCFHDRFGVGLQIQNDGAVVKWRWVVVEAVVEAGVEVDVEEVEVEDQEEAGKEV